MPRRWKWNLGCVRTVTWSGSNAAIELAPKPRLEGELPGTIRAEHHKEDHSTHQTGASALEHGKSTFPFTRKCYVLHYFVSVAPCVHHNSSCSLQRAVCSKQLGWWAPLFDNFPGLCGWVLWWEPFRAWYFGDHSMPTALLPSPLTIPYSTPYVHYLQLSLHFPQNHYLHFCMSHRQG